MKVVSAFLASTLAATSWSGQTTAATEPFDAPESAYWHADSQSWFVSNLGGGLSLAKDGVGWLSRLDSQGRVVAGRWVDGLDAPTGMATVGNRLYVGDRGAVVVIDITQARVVKRYDIRDAKFINDVAAAPNGDLYVSDTEANRLYRLPKGGEPEVFIESEQLDCPNGLYVDGNRLIIASWGPLTNPTTFETRHPGTVLTVDLKTKRISPLGDSKPIANFDGIIKVGEYYYATDWTGGRLLRISKRGAVTEILRGFRQLADLGYQPDTGIIGIPEMSSNRIFFLNLRAGAPE